MSRNPRARKDRAHAANRRRDSNPGRRALRFEPLEDRRLLATITVNTVVDQNDGIGVGGISLRDAIAAAAPSDTINFAASLTSGGPATIQLLNIGGAQLTIIKNLTINGPGANLLTINAFDPTPLVDNGDGSRIFNVDDTNPVVRRSIAINGLTLTGGDITGHGSAIRNLESLTLRSSVITGNVATGNSGGVYQYNGSLTVASSTISDNRAGYSGAGIFTHFGDVTVTDSTISGNSAVNAGGIYNYLGSLAVTNSTLRSNSSSQYGGAIWIYGGTATVTGSTITGNSAPSGAGILNTYGAVTVTSSTIIGNFAGNDGGGIWNYFGQLTVSRSTISGNVASNGAGIMSQNNLNDSIQGTTIEHSTISGNFANFAGSGVMNRSGRTVIRHSTITNNSRNQAAAGGVDSQADASTLTQVYSSIIAGNMSANDVRIVGGFFNSFQSLGYNLIGGGNAVSTFGSAGDQTFANPLLRSLTDNGGPTHTHALLAGSPAIDRGDPSIAFNPAQFDQRGASFVRVFNGDAVPGARIDIGAFERQNPGTPQTLVVDTLVDESDGNYSAGDFSLREAIGLANANFVVAETISFAPALADGTILLRRGDLPINDPLTINGLGAGQLTIDASGNDPTPAVNNGDGSRVFTIDNGISGDAPINVAISGLTLTGGDIGGNFNVFAPGGAILNRSENLTISALTITSNSADQGGGVYGQGGNLTVTSSAVIGNTAGGSGGGILQSDGNLTVTASTISGNSVPSSEEGDGGGIYFTYGNLTVTSSTITGNSAGGGGGIHTEVRLTDTVTILNSTFSGNSATNGGGLSLEGGLNIIRNSTITNNTAPSGLGGGVAVKMKVLDDRTEVSSTIIAGNNGSDVDLVEHNTNLFQSNGYNLIGTGNALAAFNQPGDQTGVADPMLGPLAFNGGLTQTHAVLLGSPALDLGDSAIVFNPAAFDQRGAPFVRVFDGDGAGGARIDIGAVERQAIPPAVFADYSNDGVANAADYAVWRKTLGSNVPNYSGADGSGNGNVGPEDHVVWTQHFGETLPEGAGAGAAVEVNHPTALAAVRPAALVASAERVSSATRSAALAEPVEHPAFAAVSASLGTRTEVRRAGVVRHFASEAMRGARHDAALMTWVTSATKRDWQERETPSVPQTSEKIRLAAIGQAIEALAVKGPATPLLAL